MAESFHAQQNAPSVRKNLTKMVKKYSFRSVLAAVALGTGGMPLFAGYPAGYYNTLNGKCGDALLEAVKEMADGHKVISYGSKTWEAFRSTDVRTIDGVDYWWDMYSNNLVETSGHASLNIEHSVANSWWGKTKNDAYKDIVHLNPSDADANNRKANYPLCELQTVTWDNGITYVGIPKNGQGGGSGKGYEPTDEYKGDFARVFMYMFCTYDDISWADKTAWMYSMSGGKAVLQPWAQALLMDWSQNDAVSQKERDRNDGIYKEQRNRNPFIDFPDLADHIWGSRKTIPFSTGGATGGDDPDPQGDLLEWLQSTNTELSEGWTYEIIDMDPALSYVWTWKSSDVKTYYLNGSGFKGTPYAAEAYAWSPVVDLTDCSGAKFSFEHAARYQTTLRDYCRVAVREDGNQDVTLLDIPEWPEAGGWKFVKSGDIDLSDFCGKKVQVGFRYRSDSNGADTWEINNAMLNKTRKPSGIQDVPAYGEEDDSFLVEVWGNNILAPEGAVIFDLNGRQVSGENLARGVYIVVKPSFRKSVKVLVK